MILNPDTTSILGTTRICIVVSPTTHKEMTSVMDIRINVLDGDAFSLSIASDASVEQLKLLVQEKTGIDRDHQILLYLGHVLEQEKRLSDYDIHSGVCIQLVKHQVSLLFRLLSRRLKSPHHKRTQPDRKRRSERPTSSTCPFVSRKQPTSLFLQILPSSTER